MQKTNIGLEMDRGSELGGEERREQINLGEIQSKQAGKLAATEFGEGLTRPTNDCDNQDEDLERRRRGLGI